MIDASWRNHSTAIRAGIKSSTALFSEFAGKVGHLLVVILDKKILLPGTFVSVLTCLIKLSQTLKMITNKTKKKY